MEPQAEQVTQLLEELNSGNQAAMESLMPLVYDELHRIAARHLSHERDGHTLQTTALVHEAFLRLVDQHSCQWQSRIHFLSVAATMMRRVLIDHAKAKYRQKRGGSNQQRLGLDEVTLAIEDRSIDVLLVDEALTRLASLDALQARVVELRFFGGLSVDETAQVLKLSEATVKRYGNSARAWLQREIARSPEP